MVHLKALVAGVTLWLCMFGVSVAPAAAAYPGANGRIAVIRPGGGGGFVIGDIWTVRPDGTGARRITHTGDNSDPVWSPDGTRIAFASYHAGAGNDIWIMRADGSRKIRITYGASAQQDPTWSPDGRWIAYSDDRGSTEDLPLAALFKIRARAQHGPPIRLTRPVAEGFDGMTDTDPDWSPQGGTIMFTRNFPCVPCDFGYSGVYRVPDTGAGGARELPTNLSDDWSSTWAPNGADYAWTTGRDRESQFGGPWDIYVHDAAGTRQLILFPDNNAVNPAWSPNGGRIAYETTFQGAVWTIRPDGTGNRRVIGDASQPDWQPLPR